jgi:hypothetical protein
MSSLLLILLCFIGAQIIYLWFYSDFFAYYLRAFKSIIPKKIYNWLLIDEYLIDPDADGSYIHYLYFKRSESKSFLIKFFLKLFGCIICLSVWFSIIIALIIGNILYVGLVFALLRAIDFILRYCNN